MAVLPPIRYPYASKTLRGRSRFDGPGEGRQLLCYSARGSCHLIETACLIADVHMPAMSGVELYRHLIDAGFAIPTILVTAHPNDVDRARALNDGVVSYLRKPVDEEHLMRCLRTALSCAAAGRGSMISFSASGKVN
jgi:CheY-like chemotaxis protein